MAWSTHTDTHTSARSSHLQHYTVSDPIEEIQNCVPEPILFDLDINNGTSSCLLCPGCSILERMGKWYDDVSTTKAEQCRQHICLLWSCTWDLDVKHDDRSGTECEVNVDEVVSWWRDDVWDLARDSMFDKESKEKKPYNVTWASMHNFTHLCCSLCAWHTRHK